MSAVYRMVPLNRMGSCRMMDSRERRVCRGSLAMSISSITILPWREKERKTERENERENERESVKVQNLILHLHFTLACDIFSKLFSTLLFFDLQTCPPCGRRPKRRRICRCLSCRRSPPGNRHTQILFNSLTWDFSLPFRSPFGFKSQHVGHLLPRADVCIDIFEHRLQGGIVSDTQVLDLDLSVLRPAVGNLRHSWDTHCPGSYRLSKVFSFNKTAGNYIKWCSNGGHQSDVIWLERLLCLCFVCVFLFDTNKKKLWFPVLFWNSTSFLYQIAFLFLPHISDCFHCWICHSAVAL